MVLYMHVRYEVHCDSHVTSRKNTSFLEMIQFGTNQNKVWREKMQKNKHDEVKYVPFLPD